MADAAVVLTPARRLSRICAAMIGCRDDACLESHLSVMGVLATLEQRWLRKTGRRAKRGNTVYVGLPMWRQTVDAADTQRDMQISDSTAPRLNQAGN